MSEGSTIAFITFSYISFIVLLLPAKWHLRAGNYGILLMVFWGALGSLTQGTTALLFRNRADNFCPGWCDFSGAVQYVYPVGFLAGSLRLLMKLESIASTRQVSQSHADRRHTLVLDIALGLGLPLLMIPLRLVVQGHRMDIVEGFGCEPPIYPSVAAVLLYQIWPLVLDLCCLGYALATIRWFLLRRRQFAAVVASSDSGLNFNKYLRLLVMSGLQVVVWTPVSIYLFVRNQTTLPHKPYDSWNSVHRHFDMTYSYTKSSGLLTPALLEDLEMGRWIGVCGALVLFLFLGTNIESMNEYRRWASVVASPFSTRSRAAAKAAVGHPVVRRHESSVQAPAEEEEGQLR
ncbi:fungal pheromone STE3G-protein-coupled receptor [Acaromyces ingoldii]|uniref:Fungal pheromone STE3G-protein-coupled receptor n=1 Tax=Acaromyces ingoldii TaxID=215250 RepID=A0A316YH25_9BASI|nr:fungal pheromone STE3G-protein-coupled receptor [Acaromyces ingoldii]PWN87045.1 fungal pheromone STE3G-protein-coupled receptor [Acaromyces ingoldii]